MSKLHSRLAQTWLNIQGSLFPWIAEELGGLTQKQQELVTTLELIRIEEFILSSSGYTLVAHPKIEERLPEHLLQRRYTTCRLHEHYWTD